VASQAQVRRQRFPGEPGDAVENLAGSLGNRGGAREHLALTSRLQQADRDHGLEARQTKEETRRAKLVEGSSDD